MIRCRHRKKRLRCLRHRAGYYAAPLRSLPLIIRRHYLLAQSVTTRRGGNSGSYYFCPGPARWRGLYGGGYA